MPDDLLTIVNRGTKLDHPAGMVFEERQALGRTEPVMPLQGSLF